MKNIHPKIDRQMKKLDKYCQELNPLKHGKLSHKMQRWINKHMPEYSKEFLDYTVDQMVYIHHKRRGLI